MVMSAERIEALERKVGELEQLAQRIRIWFGVVAVLAVVFGIGGGFALSLITATKDALADTSQTLSNLRGEVGTLTKDIGTAKSGIDSIQQEVDNLRRQGLVPRVPPTVTITSPLDSLQVNKEGHSVWFPVKGTSSDVASDQALNIHVLVYSATDWHVQEAAAVDPDGNWSLAKAYIGGQTDPIHLGSRLKIVAVVTAQQPRKGEKIQDPRGLRPESSSKTLELTVRRVVPRSE